MLEFIIAFMRISFWMFCEREAGSPALFSCCMMCLVCNWVRGCVVPMIVRPFPVCCMSPGLRYMAPCVVIPAINGFWGRVCWICWMLPRPFWSVRMSFRLVWMGLSELRRCWVS